MVCGVPVAYIVVAVSLSGCVLVGAPQYRATAILFRHGQRTPIASLPNLRSDLTTELGYGQLTNVIITIVSSIIHYDPQN